MYKLIMGIGAAIACLVALGCGSGGDEATSAPLTKAEFVKQANAICAKVARETKASLAPITAQKNPAIGVDEEALVNKALKEVVGPSMLRQAEELEGLSKPAKDDVKLARMIHNLSKSGDILTKEGWQGMGGSGFSQFQREATEYGLQSCVGLVYS